MSASTVDETAQLRAALAGALEERAALAHEVAELRAEQDFSDQVLVNAIIEVAELRKKVARLEDAIAGYVLGGSNA